MTRLQTVPFGKYKGQPIEALQADQNYCEWLSGQKWFVERFPQLRTIIVNNFHGDTDSPEHNIIQSRFIDDGYLERVVRTLRPKWDGWVKDVEQYMKLAKEHITAALTSNGKWPFGFGEEIKSFVFSSSSFPHDEFFVDIDSVRQTYKGDTVNVKHSIIFRVGSPQTWMAKFEQNGWDVTFGAGMGIDVEYYREGKEISSPPNDLWPPCPHKSLDIFVELKPSIGDDYPAVLRQIKARERPYRHSETLLLADSVESVVPTEMIRELFSRDRITLMLSNEIGSDRFPNLDLSGIANEWGPQAQC